MSGGGTGGTSPRRPHGRAISQSQMGLGLGGTVGLGLLKYRTPVPPVPPVPKGGGTGYIDISI